MHSFFARPRSAARTGGLLAGRNLLRCISFLACLAFLAIAYLPLSGADGSTLPAASSLPMLPYAYADVTSTTSYDIMLAGGASKDRRVARIKVDSVFFADIDAHVSTDASNVAFRVTGDRLGGSSLYNVNATTGKYVQIAASKTASEGIGSYAWSPAGNTLAYVRAAPALDPALMDDAYGTVYLYSVGFQAVKMQGSNGNDRVLAFSGDGLGVYADRREVRGSITLNHLVYIPISGESAILLLRSQPGLRYTRYTLWAQPSSVSKVAYLAEGDFSLAAANTNVAQVVPSMAASIQVSSKAPGSNKLTRPSGLGLMTADTLGVSQTLLRRDAESYGHISWTLDGTTLLAGGVRSGASWLVGLDGSRKALGTSLLGLHPVSLSQDGSQALLSDDPVTRLVSIDSKSGKVAATRYVGTTVKPGAAQVRLNVPYIHQVKDAPGNVDGDWACGPTSIAMSLAYYGKIDPWPRTEAQNQMHAMSVPVTPAVPATPTGADFAPYVTSVYTNNGHTYSARANDPHGTLVAGLYGTICPTGLASWPTMSSVLQWHGLSSQFVSPTWDGVVAALKRGHPVLLGNMLTSEGHILVVIGFTADGNLIVNDPYGDKFSPGYGTNNGSGILYPWKRVTARRALEVIGVYPPPKPTATPTLAPTRAPTFVPAVTPTASPTLQSAK